MGKSPGLKYAPHWALRSMLGVRRLHLSIPTVSRMQPILWLPLTAAGVFGNLGNHSVVLVHHTGHQASRLVDIWRVRHKRALDLLRSLFDGVKGFGRPRLDQTLNAFPFVVKSS